MFKAIGEAFIKMAADIIAKQLIMIALQSILKALGATTGGSSSGPNLDAIESYSGIGANTPVTGFSTGGFIGANRVALVGENGPELIQAGPTGTSVTNSEDTKAAMERYSLTNQEMAAGGPMNTTITYNGPTLNFNGDDYIPRSEASSLVAAGAKQGETRAINRLRQSRSTRSKVGI